ncbi:MAG: DNA translocase FtsK [Alistipes sp.]|nr:DNA translocase FtsK [Alistipes sp.]
MAQRVKKSQNKSKKPSTTSNDNMLWMLGFVMLILGILSIVSVLSHFVYWSADLSALRNDVALSGVVIPYENWCSSLGAHIAYWVVDCSFGVFGLLLPVVITLLGWRIFRRKSLHFNHLALSAALLLVVGSVTMGFIAMEFSLSHDIGGRLGQACAKDLADVMGDFGVIMLLLMAWILTGVYINRNVIALVNRSVDGMVHTGENVIGKVKSIASNKEKDAAQDVDSAEAATDSAEDVAQNDNLPQASGVNEKAAQPNNANEISFSIEPNNEGKPNAIDVETLLKSEESVSVADNNDEEYTFSVEVGEDKDAVAEEQPIEQQLNEDVAPGEEDEELVVKVYENKPKTLSEDELEVEPYNPLLDLEFYKKPHVSLLEDYKSPHKVSSEEIFENKRRIQETLKYFGIPIVNIDATVGPTVTLYEITQAQGVKISKIQGLEKDIAQSLRAQGIRIIAPIPGKGTIGIEVPNRDKQIVSMYSSICSEEFQSSKAELPIVIGRTIQNENFTFDLAKLPHLLVAGATGQGKSVGLNAIITSLLYRKHPAELKFVMIDPKMVEFSVYNKLEKHFLAKMESEEESIITEPKKAVYVLNSLVEEMGRRLELLKMATARNIVEYNEKFTARRLNPNKGHRFLPYIVVIIDEFADLIMTAREVEVPVMRLAQKARAVGIHLIVATQRPDVKVITGGIKANFPSRIAFRVIQTVDSRTIIDQPGANQLIGRGDMLFSKDGDLTRIQCALVETKEVERLVDFISKQQGYTEAYPLPDYVPESEGDGGASMADGESGSAIKYDSIFAEVARFAVMNGELSISLIQRNFEVGFNRAGRIFLQLERAGIIGGPQGGSKKQREVKYYDMPSLEAKLQELGLS